MKAEYRIYLELAKFKIKIDESEQTFLSPDPVYLDDQGRVINKGDNKLEQLIFTDYELPSIEKICELYDYYLPIGFAICSYKGLIHLYTIDKD